VGRQCDVGPVDLCIRRWQKDAARVLCLVSLRTEALRPVLQPVPEGVPPGLSHWLESATREMAPVHIELGPLAENETMQMMQAILLPPAPGFAQWLYDETLGQPYYLMETLKICSNAGCWSQTC